MIIYISLFRFQKFSFLPAIKISSKNFDKNYKSKWLKNLKKFISSL